MRTNNSSQKSWSDRPKPSDAKYSGKGMPVELMIQLANSLNVDPWFSIPHLADDDYIRQFAILVRDRLKPGLKVYIEYSNETWNGTFQQTAYMGEQSSKLGWGNRPYQDGALYYARRSTEMFAIWEDVFGGVDRLVRVLASHAANAGLSKRIVTWENAYQKADALAIAPYFYAPLSNGATVDQVLDGARQNIEGNVRKWIVSQKAVADAYGLDLLGYEGGQHLVAPKPHINSPETQAITEVAIAANRDPRMYDLYMQYLDQWQDLGGGMMFHLLNVGYPSRYGMWGSLEYQTQPIAEAPKYRALMQYIKEAEGR
jgi:hypothetical protein